MTWNGWLAATGTTTGGATADGTSETLGWGVIAWERLIAWEGRSVARCVVQIETAVVLFVAHVVLSASRHVAQSFVLSASFLG